MTGVARPAYSAKRVEFGDDALARDCAPPPTDEEDDDWPCLTHGGTAGERGGAGRILRYFCSVIPEKAEVSCRCCCCECFFFTFLYGGRKGAATGWIAWVAAVTTGASCGGSAASPGGREAIPPSVEDGEDAPKIVRENEGTWEGGIEAALPTRDDATESVVTLRFVLSLEVAAGLVKLFPSYGFLERMEEEEGGGCGGTPPILAVCDDGVEREAEDGRSPCEEIAVFAVLIQGSGPAISMVRSWEDLGGGGTDVEGDIPSFGLECGGKPGGLGMACSYFNPRGQKD